MKSNTYRERIIKWLLILFLAVFPFGQIFRFSFSLSELRLTLLLVDVIAGFILALSFGGSKRTKIPHSIGILLFSFFVGFSFFGVKEVMFGSLYLLRVLAYSALFYETKNLLQKKKVKEKHIFHALVIVSYLIALLGFIQYAFIPDFRGALSYGWDDHLYRLVGTFLDPGFTGILLVLGFVVSFYLWEQTRKKVYGVGNIFLLVALLLTYSRASYLAYFAVSGLLFLFVRWSMKKYIVIFAVLFILSLPLLPRPEGEGVKLERTSTVHTRVSNYEETLIMWRESPLVGLGFNTLCFARNRYISQSSPESHSCFGADSSVLLILATTGVLGFIVFLQTMWRITKSSLVTHEGRLFFASLCALFVNASFVNSLFYPWVMGWMAVWGASVSWRKGDS